MPKTADASAIREKIDEIQGKNENGEDIVYLDDTIVENGFLVTNATCEAIVCSDVIFKYQFSFSGCLNKGIVLRFINCVFEESWVIYDTTIGEVYFENCSGKIVTFNKVFAEIIHVEKSTFGRCTAIVTSVESIRFFANFKTDVAISNITCGDFIVANNLDAFNLFVTGNVIQESSVIDNLKLSIQPTLTGSVSINDITVEILVLKGKLDKAVIDFTNVTFIKTFIENFTNAGGLKFSNAKFPPDSTLEVKQVDFGKAVLFDINFQSIDNMSISAVNLNEIVHAEVVWCNKIPATNSMSYHQLREIYKQLKNVSIRQNDKPEELRFYGLEMNSYRQELKGIKKRKGDKLILCFNRITNEHGQSWSRPFGIIIATIFVIYFPIKYFLGFTAFHLTPKSIPIAASEMMECFNPVRKFSDSFGISNTQLSNTWKVGIAKVLDIFFLRLIVGLLIFQMVKAFRKYVR